nr:hypothetical protein [uncultured Roseateles sp.]
MQQARVRGACALLSLALAAAWASSDAQAQAVTPLPVLAAQRLRERAAQMGNEAERQSLLAAARAALAQGDSQAALSRLEAAGAMSHAADTEMLMVQAQVQGGNYRQALGFASHTAGAHLQEPEALTLYAWLLGLSEQPAYALRLIDAGLARMPGHHPLLALKQQLGHLEADAAPEPLPEAAAARPGPPATGAYVPSQARAVASGLLIGEGRLALVPLDAVRDAQALWVRNGLGVTRAATLRTGLDALGLALLQLDGPITPPDGSARLTRAPRDAYAGSPASAFNHLATPTTQAAWPAMHTGFLGRAGMGTTQALGIGLPQQSQGGPVFDQAGRLVGVSLTGPDAVPRMAPLSALLSTKVLDVEAVPVSNDAAKRTPDQLYEQALPLTVQVFAASP